jgi:hypothetical protein
MHSYKRIRFGDKKTLEKESSELIYKKPTEIVSEVVKKDVT